MSDSSGWKAGEIADLLREGEFEADIDAVLSDEKMLGDVLLRLARDDLEDGPLSRLLTAQTSSDMLRSARKNSDVASMSAASGLSDNRSEATGYTRLLNGFKPAAQQVVIRGGKGTGKTGTILELIRWLVRESVVEKVMMNVPVRGMSREDLEKARGQAGDDSTVPAWWLDPEQNEYLGTLDNVRFAENISTFLEFAQEPGEKLALFDEFSTVGNAYSNQQDVQAIMGSVINAFRKSMNGSLRTVYIGHENDKDIHPIVRKQSDVVISKDGKASQGMADLATVYEGWEDYLGDDRWYAVRGIRDVPDESPWRYHTNYFAHLEWDLDNPDLQIQRGRLIDGWREFQDDNEDDDGNTEPMCQATTNGGGSCPQTAVFPREDPVACHGHRHKIDEILDNTDDEDELNNDTTDDIKKSNEEIIDAMVEMHGVEDAERMLRTIAETRGEAQ